MSQREVYLQKDLAIRCHVEPATMTSILRNMSDKKLIYKKQESVLGGKRGYSIYLTDKGHSIAYKVNQIVHDMEVISFQDFDDFEKQQLILLLNHVQTNLEGNT